MSADAIMWPVHMGRAPQHLVKCYPVCASALQAACLFHSCTQPRCLLPKHSHLQGQT